MTRVEQSCGVVQMIDQGFRRRADEFRATASHAQSPTDREWATYCAGILEEQAVFLEKTGRCPEVPLPHRPHVDR